MLIYFSSSVYYKPCLNDHLEWLLVRGQIIPWPTRAHRNIWSELGFLDVSWGDKNGGIDLSLSPFLSMCKKIWHFWTCEKGGEGGLVKSQVTQVWVLKSGGFTHVLLSATHHCLTSPPLCFLCRPIGKKELSERTNSSFLLPPHIHTNVCL